MKRSVGSAIAMVALALFLTGCPEKKGPLEKAGEAIDDAAGDVQDALEDAADDLDK